MTHSHNSFCFTLCCDHLSVGNSVRAYVHVSACSVIACRDSMPCTSVSVSEISHQCAAQRGLAVGRGY